MVRCPRGLFFKKELLFLSDEFSRIADYFAPLAGAEGLGLLDDAAVFTAPAGRELVLTVDQMLEGVHFLSRDAPDLIARKLLRRNLSDLAAVAAVPVGYLLATALPPGIGEDWLEAFAQGLRQDQDEYGVRLFGGDSSSAQTHISLSATLIGHVAPGAALRRNGARAGDLIWVTGTIGDAALGLRARRGELADATGLLQDIRHICKTSGVAARIEESLVPTSAEAAAFGREMLEARLTDGDDYELILAVPPENAAALRHACGSLRVTEIGVFLDGEPDVEVIGIDGAPIVFTKQGWRHF